VWNFQRVDVTHAMGKGDQDRPPDDPLSNLPEARGTRVRDTQMR
jgi:hypothetical protein